ncbi:hypothetical protein FAZ78_25135 [Cereibacter changlensis]|uniref:Uncharacterized protein n=1 Tax=Cereibacter changlensis TaxID=402884 RepID=A0A4U0YQP8_9RHOB|nr:hypothetical protein [Cereibacter changlensis]TKA93935.1 hypothetical protein FAZ78_25135 [Cereibacter changlensis]
MVRYRRHALFGRHLRVERVDRRRSGRFVHVEVHPGVFRVLAAWMLDPVACAGMDLGAPRVSLAALADLDDLLSRRGFGETLPVTSPPERSKPMQDLPTRPSSPKQLQMQFDSTRLRGMSPLDRQQIVVRLAIRKRRPGPIDVPLAVARPVALATCVC